MGEVLTVSQLNTAAAAVLDASPLAQVNVVGEITGWRKYPSGHCYFSLRDAGASVGAVLFSRYATGLSITPVDGMRVAVTAKADIYKNDGRFQLVVRRIQAEGAGDLAARRAAILEKLKAEGLLDAGRKRPLPAYPRCVGLLTSQQGAVLHDMLQVAARRNPSVDILVFPIPVQGLGAAPRIIEALTLAQKHPVDVLILARGGGSAEDLAVFDDEALARAVAACRVPIVSAVGHETDTSICDYAADLRAATPSVAAECVFGNRQDWLRLLEDKKSAIEHLFLSQMGALAQRLDMATAHLRAAHPRAVLQQRKLRLESAEKTLPLLMQARLQTAGHKLALAAAKLEQKSPLAPLSRGYALATHKGVPISRAETLVQGEEIILRFANARVGASVQWVENKRAESP